MITLEIDYYLTPTFNRYPLFMHVFKDSTMFCLGKHPSFVPR